LWFNTPRSCADLVSCQQHKGPSISKSGDGCHLWSGVSCWRRFHLDPEPWLTLNSGLRHICRLVSLCFCDCRPPARLWCQLRHLRLLWCHLFVSGMLCDNKSGTASDSRQWKPPPPGTCVAFSLTANPFSVHLLVPRREGPYHPRIEEDEDEVKVVPIQLLRHGWRLPCRGYFKLCLVGVSTRFVTPRKRLDWC
jgi:hypothetical protein